MIPLSVPEVRRLILAMTGDPTKSETFGWDGRYGAGLTRRSLDVATPPSANSLDRECPVASCTPSP